MAYIWEINECIIVTKTNVKTMKNQWKTNGKPMEKWIGEINRISWQVAF